MPKFFYLRLLVLIFLLLPFIFLADFYLNEQQKIYGTHNSIYDQVEFFDKSFLRAGDIKKVNGVSGLFVNHHLLADYLIPQSMLLAATNDPITIVLVSPNHFSRGRGQFITSQYDWATPYGTLKPNLNLIAKLKINSVSVDELPFKEEHGVTGIVAYIKKIFPNAKIVPILVKDTASDSQVDALAKVLDQRLGKNDLIIGSFDFSHYLPSNVADFSDAKSISVLENFDFDGIKRMDIDSRPGLRLMMKYLELRDTTQFHLSNHTNSSKIVNVFSFPETTSYINGYFSKGQTDSAPNDITILSFGTWDSSTNANVFSRALGYPLEKTERLLFGTDFSVGWALHEQDPLRRVGMNIVIKPEQELISSSQIRGQDVRILYIPGKVGLDKFPIKDSIVYLDTDIADAVALLEPKAIFVPSPTNSVRMINNVPAFYGIGTGEWGGESPFIAAGIVLRPGGLEVNLFPVERFGNNVQLLTIPQSVTILMEVSLSSVVDNNTKEQIKLGKLIFKK